MRTRFFQFIMNRSDLKKIKGYRYTDSLFNYQPREGLPPVELSA